MKISKKVTDRIISKIKTFQSVAASHRTRDVSEADTVTLVKDILAEVFGFDKYHELTSEYAIKGTFCDLAVKIDGKIKYLIEVKAAAIELNATHIRQAVTYASTEGVNWVILTNGIEWRFFYIKFGQPVEHEEVCGFSILTVNLRSNDDLDKLFLLCREGVGSNAIGEFHQHIQLLNKFTVAQILLTEKVIGVVRKELRNIFPDLKVENSDIQDILNNEILKREVIEGDKVKETQQLIKKAVAKAAKVADKNKQKSPVVTVTTSKDETQQSENPPVTQS